MRIVWLVNRWALLLLLECVCLFGLSQQTSAQEDEAGELETDRDSFTQALTTVGKRRFVVESSWSFIDNKRAKETHSLPELLLRYGVTDRIEFQFGTNYEVGGAANPFADEGGGIPPEDEAAGELEEESELSYAVKTVITEQNGWLPQSAFTITGLTPTSGPETSTNLLMGYVWGWELPYEMQWASEIRYRKSSEEGDDFNTWAPSTVLKFPLGEKLAGHVEYFGIYSDGNEFEFVRHFFSPGLHYLVTPDFELGIRTGWGLNEQSANFFSNVGLGLRF